MLPQYMHWYQLGHLIAMQQVLVLEYGADLVVPTIHSKQWCGVVTT
jgi:hypothetical protein